MKDEAAVYVETDAVVPSSLPPLRQDVPERARPPRVLTMPLIALAAWFLPRRFGPRLAAAGWAASILAGVMGVWLGLGIFSYRLIESSSATYGVPGLLTFRVEAPPNPMSLGEAVRAPLAALVNVAYAYSDAWPVELGWAVAACALLAPFVLALFLLPFAASGERLGLLYGRCVRLVFWSLTLLIALGVVRYFLWERIRPWFGEIPAAPEPTGTFGVQSAEPGDTVAYFALAAFVLWWIHVLIESGRRYAGPADGPAWAPRMPVCARCGYVLKGLPVSSKCPECGHSIEKSLGRMRKRAKVGSCRLLRMAVQSAFSRGRARDRI